MRKSRCLPVLAAVLAIGGSLAGTALHAQQVGPPNFPQTLPQNTVIGRIQAGVGPASAIPFSQLGPLLTLSNQITIGSTPITGGGISGNCLTVNGSVLGQGACGTGGGGGAGNPGGSSTQVQFNNGGSAFGGISGATSNGSVLSFANGALSLTGSSSGSAILNAPASGGGTVTLPTGTTTIAGLATSQTFSAANTFSGTTNFSGPFQAAGNTMTFPAAAATLAGLATSQTFSGTDIFSATINVTGTFQAGGNTMTFPNTAQTLAGLGTAQTWTAAQTFNSGNLRIAGATSGATIINAAATATGTITVPAVTDTLAVLGTAQSWTAVQTYNANNLVLGGVTGSTQCLQANSSGVVTGTGSVCGGSGAAAGNPTGTVGLSVVNGSAITFMRSDAAPPLSQAISPTWTGSHLFTGATAALSANGQATIGVTIANGNVLQGQGSTNDLTLENKSGSVVCQNATGTQTFNCNTLTLTNALAIGQGGTGATTQQTALNAIAPTPTRAGDVIFWNGTNWVNLAGNNSGTQVLQESSAGVPSWGGSSAPCTSIANALQFNNAGSMGCVTDWTSDGTNLTAALGTITTNIKALTITGSWNAGGTTFDAPLFMNITNTASNSSSALVDIQVGGNTVFSVVPNFSSTWSGINVGTNGGLIASLNSSPGVLFFFAGLSKAAIDNGHGFNLSNNGMLSWFSGGQTQETTWQSNNDTVLFRDGTASILALANGASSTTATSFRVYNSTDNVGTSFAPTNYERAVFDWTTTANTLTIGTQSGGTGTARTMILAPKALYSAAGVALPSCAAGTKGYSAVVSDATGPTYNATYTSGGAVTAMVVCNGTNWVTQ